VGKKKIPDYAGEGAMGARTIVSKKVQVVMEVIWSCHGESQVDSCREKQLKSRMRGQTEVEEKMAEMNLRSSLVVRDKRGPRMREGQKLRARWASPCQGSDGTLLLPINLKCDDDLTFCFAHPPLLSFALTALCWPSLSS
jgi:hypothetical protein